MKKNLSILILATIILFLGIARPSEATLPVFEAGSIGFNIVRTVNSVIDKTSTFKEMLKEFGLDKIAFTIAQKASEKMTVSIVNKINGGASGDKDTNYITNFKQHFGDIGKKQLTDYSAELRSSTNPFAVNAERAIIDTTSGFKKSGINNFTLDKIPGVDWQAASTDLSMAGNRGLEFYSQLAKPQNTPAGASLLAQEELGRRIEQAKKLSELELSVPGFTPAKDSTSCVSGNGSTVRSKQFAYDQQVATLQQKITTLDNSITATMDEERVQEIEDEIAAVTRQLTELQAAGPEEGEKFSANVDPNCLITSPGDVVTGLTKLALEEPIVRNRDADEFFKIIANSLTQITSAAINKGITSLKNSGSGAGVGSISSVSSYFGGPRDIRRFEEGELGISEIPTKIIDLNEELNTTLPRLERIIDITKESMEVMRFIPVVTSDLDICTPGPDINWKKRLDDYISRQTKDLQRHSSKDTKQGEGAAATLKEIERGAEVVKSEMSLLVTDAKYNMPGASESIFMIQSVTQKTTQFQELLGNITIYQGSLTSLRSVQSQIKSIIQGYQYPADALAELTASEQQTVRSLGKLILFYDDWSNEEVGTGLTAIQKEALYKASLALYPQTGSLPADETKKDIAMRDQVLKWQWELWEELMDSTEELKQQKNLFYGGMDQLRQNLITEAEVNAALSLKDQIRGDIEIIGETFSDCLLMRTIFVNALYNSNIPYQKISYVVNDAERLIPESTPLTVSNTNALRGTNSAAYKLATRNYNLADKKDLTDEIAEAIPEKTLALKKMFEKLSILDLTDAEFQDIQNKRKNLLGETYQLGARTIPQNLQEVLAFDSQGELYCSLTKKGFEESVSGGEKHPKGRWFDEIYCNPANTGISPDIITAPPGETPVATAKRMFRNIPNNWYFSNGVNDYILFDINGF